MNFSRNFLLFYFKITAFIIVIVTIIIALNSDSLKDGTFYHLTKDAMKIDESMLNEFNSIEELYKYFHWSNSSSCQFAVDFGFNIIDYGGIAAPDGHKAVCLDPAVAPIYGDCLVYSFGINNQWAFDDAMDQMHCQVYSFDPSMGVADHNRTDRIHFYGIGLSGKDRDGKWKMRTLKSIYEMLKPLHGKKMIDVLKMDIELSEWDAIPQMIESGFLVKNVKQLAVEIHFNENDSLETYRRYFNILRNLESSAGFVRFSSRLNPWLLRPIKIMGTNDYIGFEVAWYNSRFKKNTHN